MQHHSQKRQKNQWVRQERSSLTGGGGCCPQWNCKSKFLSAPWNIFPQSIATQHSSASIATAKLDTSRGLRFLLNYLSKRTDNRQRGGGKKSFASPQIKQRGSNVWGKRAGRPSREEMRGGAVPQGNHFKAWIIKMSSVGTNDRPRPRE